MQSRAFSRALKGAPRFPRRVGGARRSSRAPGLRNTPSAEAPVASGQGDPGRLRHALSGRTGVARTGRGCPRARPHVLRGQRPLGRPRVRARSQARPAPPSGAALGRSLQPLDRESGPARPISAARIPGLQPDLTLRKGEGWSLGLLVLGGGSPRAGCFHEGGRGREARGDREKVQPPCRAEPSPCQGRRPPGPQDTRGDAPCLPHSRPRRLV